MSRLVLGIVLSTFLSSYAAAQSQNKPVSDDPLPPAPMLTPKALQKSATSPPQSTAPASTPVKDPEVRRVSAKGDEVPVLPLERDETNRPAPPRLSLPSGAGSDMEPPRLSRATSTSETMNKSNEQSLTLEWIGPTALRVGQTTSYEMVVRNAGNDTARQVTVRDRISPDMKVLKVEPEGTRDGESYVWSIGDLNPREERRLKVHVQVEKRGELSCQATVTSTMMAVTKFRVTEPKLVVKLSTPEEVMIGQPVTATITVTNPGDGPADNVTILSKLSEGLGHEKGKQVSYELGGLAAGETRNVQIVLNTVKGGPQMVQAHAAADGGLESHAESKTAVTEPKLEIVAQGPKLRYLDRQATYTVAVANPGTAPANNIKATAVVPAGFKFVECSPGGRYDHSTRTISWFIGSVKNGDKAEVNYRCQAVNAGNFKHVVAASGQYGLKGETEVATAVQGIAALLLEVVDVDDPVEAGAESSYEIRVTNQGSSDATNVEIHALVPKEMEVKGGQGPTKYRVEGQEVLFEALPRLAPRADAVFRIMVKAKATGDVRFRARLTSSSLSEPVIEEESTRIYQD